MTSMNIIWGGWQHAKDLNNRWIFKNFNTEIIEKDFKPNIEAKSSVIVVPISQTKWAITKIMESNPEQEIINFSWVMSTTPENSTQINNLHFLFWPNAKKWLKVAFAWNFSPRVNKIIKNVTCAWITAIETDIDTHDRVVSIIQALSHMFIFLSWMSDNKSLISEWNTPDLTILDMILENPKFIGLLNDLISHIQVWDNLSEIFLDNVATLTEININNFWTPTFLRVINFCMKNKMIVNEQMLKSLKSIQNRNFLLKSIHEIKITQILSK